MKLVALAGGVGGARLADGLARYLASLAPAQNHELAVVVNTGDDFDLWGLHICPDLDTVMYTLAGLDNPHTGWGIEGDTFEALGMMGRLKGPNWFQVGDRDLAVHVRRTGLLATGKRLSEATAILSAGLGVPGHVRILPMTDAAVATMVDTNEGTLAFQDYFVRRAWQPVVRRIHFKGIERARVSIEVRAALDQADLIVMCPSNPFVSIDPILALSGVREQLRDHRTVGVSPIVGGKAIKGPAAKMFAELGQEPSALAVARRYADFMDGFVIDQADEAQRIVIESFHMQVLVTDTIMADRAGRERLAREVFEFARARVGW